MGLGIMIFNFFLSLSILIVLHEFGHFAAAKWFNTRVEKFYLFFNPWFSIFKKKFGDTEYGLGWLPLGGYVKISGMIDESMDKEQMKGPVQEWEFRAKPAWQRLIIMLGGIIINFLLGFIIYAMLLWISGESYLPTSSVKDGIYVDSVGYEMGLRTGDQVLKVGELEIDRFDDLRVVRGIVLDGSRTITVRRNNKQLDLPISDEIAAYLATAEFKGKSLFSLPIPFVVKKLVPASPAVKVDLKKGDKIVKINDIETPYLNDFLKEIGNHKAEEIRLTIIREDKPITFDLKTTKKGTIGAYFEQPDFFYEMARQEYNLLQAIPAGVKKGLNVLGDQLKAFGQMFKGKIKASESLGGPIMIAQMFPSEFDWHSFWNLTAILSLILGFMNLLPIPALDGGHVLFLLWEMITGHKPGDKFMEVVTMIGFFILLGLMVFIFGIDIMRLFK
jgi:regulator of sigma E protease